jgi:alkylation response protein AidB-like acyl-CoA dehydrogenase
MDLHPTRDQDEIREAAADYLSRELPADRTPKLTETALTPAQWRGLADMGWFAMGLPEDAGGLGMSVVEEALVLREFGRCLAPPQTLATMLAAHLALALGRDEDAAALASGARRAAIAIPAEAATRAGPSAGAYRLVDTGRADLVIGWSAEGAFLAPLDAFNGHKVAAALDGSLEVCTAEGLDVARAAWRPAGGDDFAARANVLTAAVLTGGAEAIRDLSVEYAKVRHQYGHPIGAFQAVAHPIADMGVRAEAALSLLYYASVCTRDGLPERDDFSAAARSVAYNAAYLGAAASMQVHGGYGQTWDYLPHFYLKRAMILGLVGGGVEADEAAIFAADALFA